MKPKESQHTNEIETKTSSWFKALFNRSGQKASSHQEASEVKPPIQTKRSYLSEQEQLIKQVRLLNSILDKAEKMREISVVLNILIPLINLIRLMETIEISKAKEQNSKKHTHSHTVEMISMTAGIVIGAVSAVVYFGAITLSFPFLILASTIRSTAENFALFCLSIYDKFFGEGVAEQKNISASKKTIKQLLAQSLRNPFSLDEQTEQKIDVHLESLKDQVKAKQERHKDIASKTHDLIVAGVALTGAILMFTPLAPIGATIVLVTIAYSLLDTVDLNPFKLLTKGIDAIAKKIHGKPLISSTPTKEELAKKLTEKVNRTLSTSTISKKLHTAAPPKVSVCEEKKSLTIPAPKKTNASFWIEEANARRHSADSSSPTNDNIRRYAAP